MANYTTADLLAQIKRKAFIPSSQVTFTDSELLSVATDEIHNTILPAVMNTREEYYVYLQQNTLDGVTKKFSIPSRAIGLGLREIAVVVGGIEKNLPRYDIEDKIYDDKSGILYGYYLQNNSVNILGRQDGTLNLYYYLRPGQLVETSEAAQVTAVDLNANTITVDTLPTNLTVGAKLDVISYQPGFDVKVLSNQIAAIIGTTITLTDTLPTLENGASSTVVGDWVCLEDTSPVPQMPVEFFQYLAEAVTAYIMESLGDTEAYERAQGRMRQMLENAQKTISPRVDGQSKKLVPRRNRGSNSYSHWRWR